VPAALLADALATSSDPNKLPNGEEAATIDPSKSAGGLSTRGRDCYGDGLRRPQARSPLTTNEPPGSLAQRRRPTPATESTGSPPYWADPNAPGLGLLVGHERANYESVVLNKNREIARGAPDSLRAFRLHLGGLARCRSSLRRCGWC